MKRILLDIKGGIRLIWQIVFAIVLLIAASMISIVIAGIIYQNIRLSSFANMINDTMNSNWGNALAAMLSILFFYWVFSIMAKRRKNLWYELGFTKHKPIKMFLAGSLVGMLFIVGYIIPLCLMQQLKLELVSFTFDVFVALSAGIFIFAGTAFTEEIIFRGYIQHCISEKYKWWSIPFTAVLFALMHLSSMSITLMSIIYLVIGGLAFSLMRVVSKGIWFPLGFHLAWNWVEYTVFGLNNEIPSKRYFFTSVANETIWTGKDGIGLAAILAVFVLSVVLFYIKSKQNRLCYK